MQHQIKIPNLISSSIHQSSLSLLHSVISSHPSEKLAVKKKKKKKKKAAVAHLLCHSPFKSGSIPGLQSDEIINRSRLHMTLAVGGMLNPNQSTMRDCNIA